MTEIVLRCSASSRWLKCAGFPRMASAYPEDDGLAAQEGTAAHWAMAEMLYDRVVAEGQIAENGTVLTEEMIDSASVCVDDVKAIQSFTQCHPHVEAFVHAVRIHSAVQGTADVFLVDRRARHIYVWDFKHGHRPVHAFENSQLACYLAGIVSRTPEAGPEWSFTATIVQPRCYSPEGAVKRWTGRLSDLHPVWDRLSLAAEDATSGLGVCRPNDECAYCPARHACLALQADAYRAAQLSSAAIPQELPIAAISTELRMLRSAAARLQARITGLEAETETLLRNGHSVPGWTIATVPGRETWTKPPEAIIALGRMSNKDLAAKPKAITPRQAREAGVPANIVAMFSTRPTTTKLAEDDGTLARRVFGGREE